MAPKAAIDKADMIRSSVRATKHVSVTELARGKSWREELPDCDVMEIIDHGTNAGWLVSDSGMDAMLDTISYLEERLEQASMAAIANARRDYDDWQEGDELTKAALDALNSHEDALRAVLDAG